MGKHKKWTKEEEGMIATMIKEKYSINDISKKINVHSDTVRRKAKKMGFFKVKTIKCKMCANKFTTASEFNVKIFCSKKCKGVHERKQGYKGDGQYLKDGTFVRNCKICNKTFKPSKTAKLMCSDKCRKVSDEENSKKWRKITCQKSKKEYMMNKKIKKCTCCNHWHSRSYNTCSPSCSQINKKYNINLKYKKRIDTAKKNGKFDRGITIKKLIERDGYNCYLCENKTAFNKDYNSYNYPTIEHVLAIANGGTHTWDNVKVACRKCNTKKGIKIIDEK